MTNFQKGVIALIKSALLDTKEVLPDDFDWKKAVSIGRKHQIVPILYYGAINCGVTLDAETKAFFENHTMQNVVVNQKQMYQLKVLFAAFEKEGISYMPLKGSLLKNLYPKPEMRTMSDADVLIKEDEYSKTIPVMRRLGFTEKGESDHEYIWQKGVLTLELHKSILPTYHKDYFDYFGNGWRLATEKIDNYGYKMRNEDEFIYNFTHMAKHYRAGGIGIRHITDIFVCLNVSENLDSGYIEKELKKLQLWEFYLNVIDTIGAWFSDKPSNEKTDFITNYIFSSGSYGNDESKNLGEALRKVKTAGSTEKAMKNTKIALVFPSYKNMCLRNPVLKKCPILLPFMWVWRWLELVFCKRSTIKKRRNELKTITADTVNSYEESLHYVGLDFNFGE